MSGGDKNNSCWPTDQTWVVERLLLLRHLHISASLTITILHILHCVKYCINKSTLNQGYREKTFGTYRKQYFIWADRSSHLSLMFMLFIFSRQRNRLNENVKPKRNFIYFKVSGLRRRKAIFYMFLALEDTYNTHNENKEVPF